MSFQTLLEDKISIRAIEISDNKVWYVGTDSKFGYVDLKNNNEKKQIQLSDKKLQFRTLGQYKKYFYTVNIESPAYFFRIKKSDLSFKIINNDTLKTAFYDALKVYDNRLGYAFGDPDKAGNFQLAKISFLGESKTWKKLDFKEKLKLNEGEAAFAASNSNIAFSKNYLWIATGGKTSRIFRLDSNHPEAHFEVFNTPFIQGESSQGIYSIDFYDNIFGIAVGGDYTKQSDNISNIATTNDSGETWQIQASGKNAGYSTCVKIRPKSKGKEIIAIGDQHISISKDFGKTWTKVSDQKGFYTFQWLDKNTIILAGKDKIVKATFEGL